MYFPLRVGIFVIIVLTLQVKGLTLLSLLGGQKETNAGNPALVLDEFIVPARVANQHTGFASSCLLIITIIPHSPIDSEAMRAREIIV